MSIFDHFRPEEKGLVERSLEWSEWASTRNQVTLTNFLDPREQKIVQSIVGRNQDSGVHFFGGYERAERKKAIIAPKYVEVSLEDFEVTLLSITGNYKGRPFEHRDVLGSLLGLGVKREKFGDILLTEESQQVLVSTEIAPFVEIHLHQISRYNVSIEQIPLDSLLEPDDEWKIWNTTVSSLRLDVILSELLPLSRAKGASLIKGGKVKVNWRVVEQPSLLLEEGDVLSIKGFGRFMFSKIDGTTKKQRYIVELGKKES